MNDVLGCRVKVWFPRQQAFFHGTVKKKRVQATSTAARILFLVVYDDQDLEELDVQTLSRVLVASCDRTRATRDALLSDLQSSSSDNPSPTSPSTLVMGLEWTAALAEYVVPRNFVDILTDTSNPHFVEVRWDKEDSENDNLVPGWYKGVLRLRCTADAEIVIEYQDSMRETMDRDDLLELFHGERIRLRRHQSLLHALHQASFCSDGFWHFSTSKNMDGAKVRDMVHVEDLYQQVVEYGGSKAVTANKKWASVAKGLGFDPNAFYDGKQKYSAASHEMIRIFHTLQLDQWEAHGVLNLPQAEASSRMDGSGGSSDVGGDEPILCSPEEKELKVDGPESTWKLPQHPLEPADPPCSTGRLEHVELAAEEPQAQAQEQAAPGSDLSSTSELKWPKIALGVLKSLLKMRASWPFRQPVHVKDAPDYYSIIQNPMDLKTINEKLSRRQYR
ncbi:hypothetical protein CYMTET_52152 [Cymbomonas tetramitiformis]|uniref:Bromo domain-containing protein n=1 Tax=Cymbomonas tetramitiformis TaxID=36881 RepID=A0AAE0BKW2_9CHLO|nr:hypothetical protein CYMTET_52152 [Cymbomonas tetramitiformis]